jgi:hypothetical protein
MTSCAAALLAANASAITPIPIPRFMAFPKSPSAVFSDRPLLIASET